MTKEDKQKAVDVLRAALGQQRQTLEDVEPRLHTYFCGLVEHPEVHNAYEILGGCKFLRLLRTYELDTNLFHDVVLKYEGTWNQDASGVWRHQEGGMKHPGTTGPQFYRLQPFQVFVLASMFLFKVWINTEAEAGSREMLPTEKVMEG